MDENGPTQLRQLLEAAALSQRGAARELEIDERTMRRYCAGEVPTPRVVWLALERLRDVRSGHSVADLQRLIDDLWQNADPEAWPKEWHDRVAKATAPPAAPTDR